MLRADVGAIPDDATAWAVSVRGAKSLAETLSASREQAALYKVLATLRTDHPVGAVADWRWTGPPPEFAAWTQRLGAPGMLTRAERLAESRA